MEEKVDWYQIRIYSRGFIKIFQNVFIHRIFVHEGDSYLKLCYSKTQNDGCYTISTICLNDVYLFQIIDNPKFDRVIDYNLFGESKYAGKMSELIIN